MGTDDALPTYRMTLRHDVARALFFLHRIHLVNLEFASNIISLLSIRQSLLRILYRPPLLRLLLLCFLCCSRLDRFCFWTFCLDWKMNHFCLYQDSIKILCRVAKWADVPYIQQVYHPSKREGIPKNVTEKQQLKRQSRQIKCELHACPFSSSSAGPILSFLLHSIQVHVFS